MTVLARIAAVLLSIAAFLASAYILLLTRGLEDGALVDLTGRVALALPGGAAWPVGVGVFVVMLLVVWFVDASRSSWLLFALTLLALLIAGTIATLVVPSERDALPTFPLALLLAGAASPLSWALAALSAVVGLRQPNGSMRPSRL